jgi:hypothetical protein
VNYRAPRVADSLDEAKAARNSGWRLKSSAQLDLFPVRATEDDPAPVLLARLSCGRGMGRRATSRG